MIRDHQDLKDYMEADRLVVGNGHKHPRPFSDYTWKYLICLRRLEYFQNTGKKVRAFYYKVKHSRMSAQLGIDIQPNCFGKGLGLYHYGSIIVNGNARFGDYCVIQSGTNISDGVVAGDQVYIAAGAKVVRNIRIADHVIVAANAAVVRDVEEEGVTVGGVPAKKISENGFYRTDNEVTIV